MLTMAAAVAAAMNFLKAHLTKKVRWATWQFSALKLSMISFGIILGSYFAGFWKPLLPAVWAVFTITVILSTMMWLSAVRKK
ncbi:hypothetical protein HYY73_03295 [Candidatus Woesearchaeota archaeon]|nr:hypothetical protein [Candidatus Woesearchaeota archaeon]